MTIDVVNQVARSFYQKIFLLLPVKTDNYAQFYL